MSRLIKSQDSLTNCFRFVLIIGFISLIAIGGCNNNGGGQGADFNIILENIELEPGIVADINIVVFENISGFCQNLDIGELNENSIFAVHGIQLNAQVWSPLANALFIDNPTGDIVCRFIAIEMPGHGDSGLPEGGLLFGQMSEENYTNVLLNSLERLALDYNIRPSSLIAHSNGGVVTQLAQQKLSGQGTTLNIKFGIEKITLLAPVISAPVVAPKVIPARELDILEVGCFFNFSFSADCTDIDVIAPFGQITWEDILAVNATTINNPVYDCDPLTVPIGSPMILPAPPMPHCENPTVLGDHLPAGNSGAPEPEPLTIIREVIGMPPQQRPFTSPGIFGGHMRATFQIVAFEMDEIIGPPIVEQDLFNHLSVGENSKFHIISGPNSNHTMFFFTPEEFLAGLAAGDICLLP